MREFLFLVHSIEKTDFYEYCFCSIKVLLNETLSLRLSVRVQFRSSHGSLFILGRTKEALTQRRIGPKVNESPIFSPESVLKALDRLVIYVFLRMSSDSPFHSSDAWLMNTNTFRMRDSNRKGFGKLTSHTSVFDIC